METNEFSFKPADTNEPYIFASYAHEDKDAISDIEKLNELGFRIWYDEIIPDADEWEKQITSAIRQCSVILVFVSKASVNSKWVRREIRRADDEGKKILPIFFEKGTIKTENLIIDELYNIQGVERFKFVDEKNWVGYYSKLIKSLPKNTRKCDEERDCEILGMFEIPSLENLVGCKEINTEFDRQSLIQKLRKDVHDNKEIVYTVDTVFQLTSDKTNADENLSKLDIANPSKEKPSNILAHPLNINTSYITPLRLITGLITHLDENWPPLVTSYGELVHKDTKNKLDDLHFFIEFCWQAWGPSILTTSLLDDNSTNFMVAQVAFGDEANSLPLIMKKEYWELIKRDFGNQYSGWPASLKNLLVVKPGVDDFFESLRYNDLIHDMFKNGDEIALYLPYDDKGYNNGEILQLTEVQESFYSTAYVWLMLEQIPPSEINTDPVRQGYMQPGKVIPFFEHANLATRNSLDFLQHCLARKAVYHILECESDPTYREKGYYTFATALFPEKMIEILEKETEKLNTNDQLTLKKRFKIPKDPKSWRTPFEVVKFTEDVKKAIDDCCRGIIRKTPACNSCSKKKECVVEKIYETAEY